MPAKPSKPAKRVAAKPSREPGPAHEPAAPAPPEAPKPAPSEAQRSWAWLLFLLVLGAVALFVAVQPQPRAAFNPGNYTVTVSPQPAGIGWVDVAITTERPIESVSVSVSGTSAQQRLSEPGRYEFRWYASPYETQGILPMRITFRQRGEAFEDRTRGVAFQHAAILDTVNGILFYNDTYPLPPVQQMGYIVHGVKTVNFFFEAGPNTETNAKLFNAYIPLVERLGAYQKEVRVFGLQTDSLTWSKCVNDKGKEVSLAECELELQRNPSILLRYPLYSTSQVRVTNTTAEIMPALATLDQTMVAVIGAIDITAERLGVTVEVPGNKTDNMSVSFP
jgi:hypothetical protein